MQIDVNGKTALVTGSTQGIGAAIATALGEAGAVVGVNGRTVESVTRAIDSISAQVDGARLVPVVADVTTEAGVAATLSALPDVDILVNNFGIFGAQDALTIDDDEWRRYFEVNVLSAVRLIRTYLPGMMERGWGRVLDIASDSAIVIPREMIHYEAAGTGVTVNSVIAGPTHTGGVEDFVYELVDRSLPWEEAQREFMRLHRPQSLLQRLIEPEEIANLVVYLSSPLASATTGAAVRVDGGYVDSIVP
jgi:NAD(P)-dependent dehydrogenase (short-subunit alcohol dehydrogenase family)